MADETFKITIKGTGLSFDQSVDKSAATRIMSFVMTGSALTDASNGGGSGAGAAGGGGSSSLDGLNPKQFIAKKKPQTQYERIACLGYFLRGARNISEFGTEEIRDINKEAAQHPILNLPQIMNDTMGKYKFISPATGGKKQMTVLGDDIVDALPEREAVKAARAEHRTGKKRKKRATKKKK